MAIEKQILLLVGNASFFPYCTFVSGYFIALGVNTEKKKTNKTSPSERILLTKILKASSFLKEFFTLKNLSF